MAYKFELQVAIEEGDFDKFLELFELSDLDCDDYDGSLLHSAASFGTLQMVEFLVAKGAEINRPGGTFRAPALTYAADCGNVDIVRFLVETGTDVDISTPTRNPLLLAVGEEHFDVVQYLLTTAIDRNACYRMPNGQLNNALTEGLRSGNRKIVELLRAEGCKEPVEGVDRPLWEPKTRNARDRPKPAATKLDAIDQVDRGLYLMMDALPFNIGFELNNLMIIDAEKRHCAFEIAMTDAAMKMLNLQPPLEFTKTLTTIEQNIEKLRNGEELDCAETFPAAALGVLWGWQLVTELNWEWCAARQDNWETLAICDQNRQYFILPVQYMRTIAGETGRIGERNLQPITKWPRDHISDIRNGALPSVANGSVVRIC